MNTSRANAFAMGKKLSLAETAEPAEESKDFFSVGPKPLCLSLPLRGGKSFLSQSSRSPRGKAMIFLLQIF